jgi:uroporphyrinogen III methyltransferase/synthase
MVVMTAARPLDGRTVVVTRAAEQAASFATLLEQAGARVLHAPTIAIEAPASWAPLDDALADLGRFTWVIFTSVNGVSMVEGRLGTLGRAWAAFGTTRIAAIGPATAAALEARGLRAEIVPGEYRAEGLVERLRGVVGPGDRVLLPRAAETRDILVRELCGLGAEVREVAAYQTRARAEAAEPLRRAFAEAAIDAVTFTSSSTARNFARLFTDEERRRWFAGVTVASIGPVTAATAAEYGLRTAVMPSEYTIPALASALSAHFAKSQEVSRWPT